MDYFVPKQQGFINPPCDLGNKHRRKMEIVVPKQKAKLQTLGASKQRFEWKVEISNKEEKFYPNLCY